jgi:hypothetical protein
MSELIDTGGNLDAEDSVISAMDALRNAPQSQGLPNVAGRGVVRRAPKPIHVEAGNVVEAANAEEEAFREAAYNNTPADFGTGPVSLDKIGVVDFANLNMEDVYNLDIPIEAKAFGSTDPLKVDLVDKNYEARWVYKSPRRLGQMLTYGFIYVEPKDLAKRLEVEVQADASGHYYIDDVVLMRIPKAIYYPALKAAHMRSVQTMRNAQATGSKVANEYMTKHSPDFAEAHDQGKISFYKPNIEI